jgi:hypothetical protein
MVAGSIPAGRAILAKRAGIKWALNTSGLGEAFFEKESLRAS